MNAIIQSDSVKAKSPSESAVRRKAVRKGYRLTKIREGCCWFDQYGPYMLADASTKGALVHGLTLEEANYWLANNDAASWLAGVIK